jgi:hypothetical protein
MVAVWGAGRRDRVLNPVVNRDGGAAES